MTATPSANQGWKDYWKEDRIASCVPEKASTASEIREWWVERFAGLPDGSRILDVATGNGVLLAHAAIAAERGDQKFVLTGIDLADIDPLRYVSNLPARLHEARFISGTAAERLPFGNAEFDRVVSQYGLEYADLNKALGEIERVLCSGGSLLWLAHSEESSVVKQNRGQGTEVEYLLASGSPLHAMRQLIIKIRKQKSLEYAGKRLQSALVDAEQYCRAHPPAQIVHEVCTVLADTAHRWQSFHPGDLDRMLGDSRKRLIAHRQRINDLLAAVMSPERQDTVHACLRKPGWDGVSVEEVRVGSDSSPIGVLIQARRITI